MFRISYVAKNLRCDPFPFVKDRDLSEDRLRLRISRHWTQGNPKMQARFRGRRSQSRRPLEN
jgi:hypothetical protein